MEGAIFKGVLDASGQIIYRNKNDFEGYCTQYANQEVAVSISPAVRNSTKLHMYSYYQSVILPYCIKALTDEGYDGIDEDGADTYLKSAVANGVIINKRSGEKLTYLLEKKRMHKDRLSKFINDCIMLLEKRHSVIVPDSQSYLESKRTGNMRDFKKIR